MRVAFSGAHGTGKSTLIAEVSRRLPRYRRVEEPYHDLLAEGHAFGHAPAAEDFELQLERSLTMLAAPATPHVLFDRCPADFLAYLAAVPTVERATLARWLPLVTGAVAELDLIVFVPIERPDRIHLPADEGRRLRTRVDAVLREMLMEDAWGLGARVMEARGTPGDRADQVLARLARTAS